MKMILLTLLMAACSSPKKMGELKKGQTFSEIKEARENPPSKVTNLGSGSYITWDGQVLVFKNDIYQHTLETPAEPEKYKLAMDSLKNKDASEKTVFLKQWNKETDATEWKRFSPLVKAILTENGFTVVEKPEEAEQMLRLSFGIQEMSGGNLRYLNLNSIDSKAYLHSKKESSFWKVKLSSWGTGRNLEKILPIMMIPVDEFLKKPETKVSSPVVDESSYDVIILKDYFGIK